MLWNFVEQRYTPLQAGFPYMDQTAVAVAPLADYGSVLFASEKRAHADMGAARQDSFASGRHCAHLAQSLLGRSPQAIGRRQRVPQWPDNLVGSITHSLHLAAAIVSATYAGVGIDLEKVGRVTPKLYPAVLTPREQAVVDGQGPARATLIFSAKEAAYKAIYPLVQCYIGFQEAEVLVAADGPMFRIRYLGAEPGNFALNDGQGYWAVHDDVLMTVFTIPRR